MTDAKARCVILADRHHGLSEGVRALLQSMFEVVVMVADERSLIDSATRLKPALAVVDLSLERAGGLSWLKRLHEACPESKILVIGSHDAPSVARAVRSAGADGFVLKHAIPFDLLPAAEKVLAGGRFPGDP